MIRGTHVLLRQIEDKDWPVIESWGHERGALWGPFQRFQLDHLPSLHEAYLQSGLLKREMGFLLIETIADPRVIGFVRYTLLNFPDADLSYPEIGFAITEANARGQGFAKEATGLLVDYLFAGHPAERVAAFTDAENLPAQRLLESLGFQREGVLRRTMFRDGRWRDMVAYAVLRQEWSLERPSEKE